MRYKSLVIYPWIELPKCAIIAHDTKIMGYVEINLL